MKHWRCSRDSPYTPLCTQTYLEWRALGTSIAAALIRAGEAAREADRRG